MKKDPKPVAVETPGLSKAPAKQSAGSGSGLGAKMNFVLVFFGLSGVFQLSAVLIPEVQHYWAKSCSVSSSFGCVYGPSETANAIGVLLFIAIGYWLFKRWLRAATLWQLVLAAVVTFGLMYWSDVYLNGKLMHMSDPVLHGFAFQLQWSRDIVATLVGTVIATVPVSKLFGRSK